MAAPAKSAPSAAVTMRFLGAGPKSAINASQPLPGHVNYLIGNDPSRWTTNLPTFGEVRVAGIYEGVDVSYYGNGRQLEYDLIVKPGADPSVIQVKLSGASQVALEPSGDMRLETVAGTLRQNRPVAYQEVDGVRRHVDVRYALNDDVFGFEVGEYDHSQPLLIDPLINYSSYLGGSGNDLGTAVGIDGTGHAYVTGNTQSLNFPTIAGALSTALEGAQDVFVSKINPAGTALVYSTYVGGNGVDSAQGLAVSSAGIVTVTGDTQSTNFPTTGGQTTYAGAGDAFVFRLSAAGAGDFSTYLGGSDADLGNAVSVDDAGNAYVAGTTGSSTFPGAVNTFGGFSDAFVTKVSAAGAVVYSRFVGGNDFDAGFGIVVDEVSDEPIVVGDTFSPNFPVLGAIQATLRVVDRSDGFVTRLNAAGTGLAFSTYFGGTDFDSVRTVALDDNGSIYFTGTTYSNSGTGPGSDEDPPGEHFPITSGAQLNGSSDAFVTKLPPAGNSIGYCTYVGGDDLDTGYAIDVDSLGQAWIAGETFSLDFPTVAAAQAYFGGGVVDAFVAQVHASGLSLVFSSYLGGEGDDLALGVAVSSAEDAYVTGATASAEFPITTGAPQTSLGGGTDGFIVRIGAGVGVPLAPTNLRGTGTTISNVGLAWDDNSNNETGFQLERSEGGGPFLLIASPTGVTFSDTDVEPLATYIYRVRAVNASGGSPYSNQLTVNVPTTLPAAPTNLTAVVVNASQIDLAWSDNADNEDYYKLERKDGDGDFILIAELPEDTEAYSDEDVTAGHSYTYRVSASNAMGDSAPASVGPVGGYSGGKIKVTPLKLNFPKVKAAPLATVKKKKKVFTIQNTAKTALQGTVMTPVEPFTILSGGGPFNLLPKKKLKVVVEFAPTEVDIYQETLTITSTDPGKPIVNVTLKGVGK